MRPAGGVLFTSAYFFEIGIFNIIDGNSQAVFIVRYATLQQR